MLRITGHDERVEEWLRPIPFRRHASTPTRGSSVLGNDSDRPLAAQDDSISLAEAALDRAQRDIDDMNRLLRGPLPFPAGSDDDGPSAA